MDDGWRCHFSKLTFKKTTRHKALAHTKWHVTNQFSATWTSSKQRHPSAVGSSSSYGVSAKVMECISSCTSFSTTSSFMHAFQWPHYFYSWRHQQPLCLRGALKSQLSLRVGFLSLTLHLRSLFLSALCHTLLGRFLLLFTNNKDTHTHTYPHTYPQLTMGIIFINIVCFAYATGCVAINIR